MAFLSVIIPTANRNDLLKQCLQCLLPANQQIATDNYEVIVSDDSVSGSARAFIEKEFPWVKWVKGPSRGPAANRNNGAREARGSWLLFTDDDCLPDHNWIRAYLNVIEQHTDARVLEGCTRSDRPRHRYDEEAPVNETGDKLWSCNFAIAKETFDTVNGFDETFPYAAMEDTDLHMRLKQITAVVFVKEAVVIHGWRRIIPFKSFKKHLASHKALAKKYGRYNKMSYRWSRFKIFAGSILPDAATLMRYKFKGILVYFEKQLLNLALVVC